MAIAVQVMNMEQDVAFARPAQRIGFDLARRALAVLLDEVDLDSEPIGGGEADDLKRRSNPTRSGQRAKRLAQDRVTRRERKCGRCRWAHAADQPSKEFRQHGPKSVERRQGGELVRQHRRPITAEFGFEGANSIDCRQDNALEVALAA